MTNDLGSKVLNAKATKQAALIAKWRRRLAELREQPQTLDVQTQVAALEVRVELGLGLLSILDQTQAKWSDQ